MRKPQIQIFKIRFYHIQTEDAIESFPQPILFTTVTVDIFYGPIIIFLLQK